MPAKRNSPKKASFQSRHYDEFFGPLYFEPYAIEIVKRINFTRVHTVLEIAAGTGRVTRHLRENILPGSRLIASDISEDMMTVGREKLSGTDIEWKQIDAQALPFPDNTIDLIVCCFGYMFVDDKLKAFAEAFRVLTPGGQFIMTTWDKLEFNGASHLSAKIAREYTGDAGVADDRSTSMHEESLIRKLLLEGGFSTINIEKVRLISNVYSAREAAEGFIAAGGPYEKIRHQLPGVMREVAERLETTLGDEFGSDPMAAPVSALIAQGSK